MESKSEKEAAGDTGFAAEETATGIAEGVSSAIDDKETECVSGGGIAYEDKDESMERCEKMEVGPVGMVDAADWLDAAAAVEPEDRDVGDVGAEGRSVSCCSRSVIVTSSTKFPQRL